MEWAKTALYGGQYIKADWCNYNSFANLLLICPECGDSVYLVKHSEKRRSHKRTLKNGRVLNIPETKVKKYFNHRSNSEKLDCPLRVETSREYKSLETKAIESKNQRISYFQQRLHWIVNQSLPMQEIPRLKKEISQEIQNKKAAKEYLKFTEEIAFRLAKSLSKEVSVSDMRRLLEFNIKHINKDSMDEVDQGDPDKIKLLKEFKAKSDDKLQIDLACEIYNVLIHPRNHRILKDLMFWGMHYFAMQYKTQAERLKNAAELADQVKAGIAFNLYFIPFYRIL